MARIWLNEQGLSPSRLIGVLISLIGLATIFSAGMEAGSEFVYGLGGMLIAVTSHSASAVWVKRIDAQLHGLVVTAGGLLVAVPLFLLSWFLQGESWPQEINDRAMLSIIYLGLIGSVVGFTLYFYILRHIETTKVALITLVTPLLALLAGQWLNAEQIDEIVWFGTGMILLGLALFELGGKLVTQLRFSRARESEGQ
jgi:drug/metabolite transporter (DMT)-like permease